MNATHHLQYLEPAHADTMIQSLAHEIEDNLAILPHALDQLTGLRIRGAIRHHQAMLLVEEGRLARHEYALPTRLGNPTAAHLYAVEVEHNAQNGRGTFSLDVDANTRNQAAAIARAAGYAVCSVNMIG